jgi:hypothetical protein
MASIAGPIISWIAGKIANHELDQWAGLVASSFLSWFISLTGTTGFLVTLGTPWPNAIGAGLLISAACLTTVIKLDKQGKKLTLVIPSQVDQEAKNTTDITVEQVKK